MIERTKAQMYEMIKNANTKIASCNDELDSIREKRKVKLTDMVRNAFTDVMSSHKLIMTVDRSGEYFTFKSQNNNDIINISFRSSNWIEDKYDEIYTNVYGTSSSEDSELQRFVILGQFGERLLRSKNTLLSGYNTIRGIYRERLNYYNKLKTSLQSQKSELVTYLASSEMEEMRERGLTSGFEYDEPITVWINNDTSIRRVKCLKIKSFTPSGKSANIELKVDNHSYEFKNVRVRFLERYYN